MEINKKEVIQRLTFEKFLNEEEKIVSEAKFKDLILAVLLSFIAHNKILFNWNRDLKENRKLNPKEKSNKIKNYFSLPFHFLGMGNKTIFIADKNPKDKFLREEFVDTLVTCCQDIDVIRRVADLWDISDNNIKDSHSCLEDKNRFCKDCKNSFDNHLIGHHEKLFKSIDIKSYIVLDVNINTIKNFIDEDDILEEIEEMQCKRCFRYFEEYDRFCSNCGLELEKKRKRESNDREKMFNYLLAIYLSKKNNVSDFEANSCFHKGTRETDILLKNDKKRMLLEITTQISPSREYITEKAISLLIMQAILPKDYESYMVFWSLDKNNHSEENYSNIKEMFDKERFFLVKSSLPKDILKNPTVGIVQEDISLLKDEFQNIMEFISEKINILLK